MVRERARADRKPNRRRKPRLDLRQVSPRPRAHQYRRHRHRQARARAAEAHRGARASAWTAADRRCFVRRADRTGRSRPVGVGDYQSARAVGGTELSRGRTRGVDSQNQRDRDSPKYFRTSDARRRTVCVAVSTRSDGSRVAVRPFARAAGTALCIDTGRCVLESAEAVDFRWHQRNSEEHHLQDDRSLGANALNFEFSDEQRQLHDAVERYLSEQYSFDRYQSIKRSAAGWDPSVWRGLADLGVLAITVPAAQGGLGFGPLETLAMMGDCGRSLLLEPVLSSAVIATAVLRAFADETPAGELLAGMGTGERIAVLAHFESDARFESQWVTTRARRSGDSYRLDGHKAVVMHAGAADSLLVSARTAGEAGDASGIDRKSTR